MRLCPWWLVFTLLLGGASGGARKGGTTTLLLHKRSRVRHEATPSLVRNAELLRSWSSQGQAVQLLVANVALATLRCLASMGQPRARAIQERLSRNLDDGLLAPLPEQSMPSISALLHLGVSLLLPLLLASFMETHGWIERWVRYRRAPSLQEADAVFIPSSQNGRGAVAKLRAAGHIPPSFRAQLLDPTNSTLLNLHPGPSPSCNSKSVGGARTFALEEREYLLLPRRGRKGRVNIIPVQPAVDGTLASRQDLMAHAARGLTSDQAAQRLTLYGTNTLALPLPSVAVLLARRFLGPFSLLQMSSQFLAVLEEHWFLPFARILSTVLSEGVQIARDVYSSKLLRDAAASPSPTSDARENPEWDRAFSRVRRDGNWTVISTAALVPGDVIALPSARSSGRPRQQYRVPCDCLLLEGAALVSEAAQTGESAPQSKTAWAGEHGAAFSCEKCRGNVLLSGSAVIQTTPSPHSPVTALVLRTGFHSSQGALLHKGTRSGAESTLAAHHNNDAHRLAALLTAWAFLCSIYVASQARARGRDSFSVAVQITRLALSVVPPELQCEVGYCVHSRVRQMARQSGIYCIEPGRLTAAGMVTVCVLDKTGTITADDMVVEGCYPGPCDAEAESLHSAHPVHRLGLLSSSLRNQACLASCHSLVLLRGESEGQGAEGGRLVGDPMEAATLQGLAGGPGRWACDGDCARLLQAGGTEGGDCAVLTPTRVFAFDPTSRLMTVVSAVNVTNAAHPLLAALGTSSPQPLSLVSTKGSPEAVLPRLHSSQREDPAFCRWFHATHRLLSQRGLRVLAVASRVDPTADVTAAQQAGAHEVGSDAAAQRRHYEHNLVFSSFLAFHCPVRADSAEAVGLLKAAGVEVVMCTGDGLGTAVHVARSVGVGFEGTSNSTSSGTRNNSNSGTATDYAELCLEEGVLLWRNADGEAIYRHGFSSGPRAQDEEEVGEDIKAKASLHGALLPMSAYELRVLGCQTLATTGPVLAHCLLSPALVRDVLHCSVFARVDPDAKALLVRAYQGRCRGAGGKGDGAAEVVLMCGDGSNDVGALRAADVGLALLGGFGLQNVEKDAAAPPSSTPSMPPPARKSAPPKAPFDRQAQTARVRARVEALAAAHRKSAQQQGRYTWGISEYFKALRETAREEWALGLALSANSTHASADASPSAGAVAALLGALPPPDNGGLSIGDASVAAPFTSTRPTLLCVVDLVRAGRAAQSQVVQAHLQVALDCIMCGHALSFGYLRGIHKSAKHYYVQVALSAILTAATEAVPLLGRHEMAGRPPPRGIFRPALLALLAAQSGGYMLVLWAALGMSPGLPPSLPSAPPTDGAGNRPDKAKFAPSRAATVAALVDLLRTALTPSLSHLGRPWQPAVSKVTALRLASRCGLEGLAMLVAVLCVRGVGLLDLVPLGWAGMRLGAMLALLTAALNAVARNTLYKLH